MDAHARGRGGRRQPDGSLRAVVDTTRDQLRNAPEFKVEGNVGR